VLTKRVTESHDVCSVAIPDDNKDFSLCVMSQLIRLRHRRRIVHYVTGTRIGNLWRIRVYVCSAPLGHGDCQHDTDRLAIVVFRRQMVFSWTKNRTTLKSKSAEAITLVTFIRRLWFESRLAHLRTWELLLLWFFSIPPRHFQILKLIRNIHLKGPEWSSQVFLAVVDQMVVFWGSGPCSG
jgi:hypothetical protein